MADEVSKEALERAYKRLERDALERTQQQENPRAILLGGQPGSGKSELANQSLRELRQSGGAVTIDADRMREENPRYQQLSKEDPQNAADRTHKEAAEWSMRLTVTAIEQRRNLVVDGTMRSPENMRALATRLKENGYDVEARVMAVDPETSITRARLRFEEQVSVRGNGRFVNQEQHDNAYAGIPRSVNTLEREKLVDRIRVYDPNQRQVYENAQDSVNGRRRLKRGRQSSRSAHARGRMPSIESTSQRWRTLHRWLSSVCMSLITALRRSLKALARSSHASNGLRCISAPRRSISCLSAKHWRNIPN